MKRRLALSPFVPLLFAMLPFVAACSNEPVPPATPDAQTKPQAPAPPQAAAVGELIAGSPEFGDYQFTNAAVSIPVAGSQMSEPTRALARELASAGWIAFDGAGDIMLTDRSRSDRRFLMRENGILDIVPIAKKEMGEVGTVRQNPDGTASADFTWRWVPNEVGSSFKSGMVHDRLASIQQARATLIWDGTAWSVLGIDAR